MVLVTNPELPDTEMSDPLAEAPDKEPDEPLDADAALEALDFDEPEEPEEPEDAEAEEPLRIRRRRMNMEIPNDGGLGAGGADRNIDDGL